MQNGAAHSLVAQYDFLAHAVGSQQLETLLSVGLSLTGETPVV